MTLLLSLVKAKCHKISLQSNNPIPLQEVMVVAVEERRVPIEVHPSQPSFSFLRDLLTSDSPNSRPPVDIPVSDHKVQEYCHAKNKNQIEGQGKRRMNITTKKLLVIVLFILSAISLLRLLRITASTSSSTPQLSSLQTPKCSSKSPCTNLPSGIPHSLMHQDTSSSVADLTKKELQLLRNIISKRSPCKLLVFGLPPEYLFLSSLNTNGTTIFLDDNPENLKTIRTNNAGTQIYKVKHHVAAKEAYNLLKQARVDPVCAPQAGPLRFSSCKLALKQLPNSVYELKWDVILVDGQRTDKPEEPGRMSAIYTAAMIARTGNLTDVLVHDVDKMIEKWFTREFLCEENLISSKGKLWHLRITGNSSSTSFCSRTTIQIL